MIALLHVVLASALVGGELPAPTGPYRVGSRRFHWIDESRLEGATEEPDDRRQLFVQVWYPAERGADEAEAMPYLRQPEAYPEAVRDVVTHSLVDAELDASLDDVPVVLFSHGWRMRGSAYTALLEDVASHGYLVAAVDQPYQGRIALPDGTVTEATEAHFSDPLEMVAFYGQDLVFALDRLAELDEPLFGGRLALDRAASVGHSNGALGALRSAQVDDRVRACLVLDKWDPVFEQVFAFEKPLMILRTGTAPRPSRDFSEGMGAPLYDVGLGAAGHLSCSDGPLLDAPSDAERVGALGTLAEIRLLVVTFLDAHLRGSGPVSIRGDDYEAIELRSYGTE